MNNNLRGAAFITTAMLGFTLNDAAMKLALEELTLYQAVFLRGFLASFLMGWMAWRQGALARLRALKDKALWLRTLAEVGGTICFLTALAQMELANATMILQALPLLITLGAAWFLGERVGWRRYSAIIIGFIGVLIIIRPGAEGFTVFSLLVMAAALCFATRDLATRRITSEAPSGLIALSASLAIWIMSGIGMTTQSFAPVDMSTALALMASAICLMSGYVFSILAMRTGDVGFTSPFRYTGIVFAVLVGYWVFSEIPDQAVIIGGAIVVATGLFTLYREQAVKDGAPS